MTAGVAPAPAPSLRRAALRMLKLVFWVWVTTAVLAVAFQRYLVFPAHLVRIPDNWAWNEVQKVSVPTADGETLKGFWRPPDTGGAVVITFHGNASLPEAHAERFAAPPWTTRGWGMLAIAYRGYPGSTGSPSEEGLLADGEAAVAFVRRLAPDADILFHGHSLGTGVAVAMAARHSSKGLYLEAGYPSILAVARHRAPFLPTFLLRDTIRSEDRVGAVESRTVAIHGATDPVIPERFGRTLADRFRPGTSTYLVVPGDHFTIFGEADEAQEPLFRAAPVRAPSRAGTNP